MKIIRTYDILEYVKRRGRCSVEELMERFEVSSATIHRDISVLVARNALERYRGGVVYADAMAAKPGSSDFQARVIANWPAKEKIAERAVPLVAEGDILFLDASTTVLAFALKLKQREFDRMTIVTNSVSIMQNFGKFPSHWVLIGLGGNYDPQLNSMVGEATRRQLAEFSITKAFISAFGLDSRTATTLHESKAAIVRNALAAAEKRYLLVDSSKLGRKGLYRLAPRTAFAKIITDKARV